MGNDGYLDVRSRAPALALGVWLALAASVGVAEIPGYPAQVQQYDRREVALLPRYCVYTQDFRAKLPGGNDPAQIKRLTREMGPTFNHMHHYCWGLMKTNRGVLLARTAQDKRFNLTSAIEEFDYVLTRSPPDFPLLPEILTKKGENLIRLDRAGSGLVELQQAVHIKANYAPAYAAIVEYYKDAGQLARAREWLDKGLAAAPTAPALMRQRAELNARQSARKQPSTGR
jgi:tetratricopeptide (TPR) repeat protein